MSERGLRFYRFFKITVNFFTDPRPRKDIVNAIIFDATQKMMI